MTDPNLQPPAAPQSPAAANGVPPVPVNGVPPRPPAPAQPPAVVPPGYAPPPAAPAPGYAPPPAPGQPAYTTPGYAPPAAAQPAYGQPAYPPPSTGGGMSWGLGFLAYIPIPIVNFIVAGIVMASVRKSVAARGPVAEGNARNAANWGLTAALVVVVAFGLGLIVGPTLGSDGAWLAVLLGIVFLATAVSHVVLCIMGLVKAGRGRVLRVPFAIPYFRE